MVYAASPPLPPTPGCDLPLPLTGRTATLKFCTNATLCPSGETQPVVAAAPFAPPRPAPPPPPRPAPRPRPVPSLAVGGRHAVDAVGASPFTPPGRIAAAPPPPPPR